VFSLYLGSRAAVSVFVGALLSGSRFYIDLHVLLCAYGQTEIQYKSYTTTESCA